MLNTALKFKFYEHLNKLSGKDYLSAVISFGAAPTIKGKKPSSLMTFTAWRKNSLALWQCHKHELCRDLDLDFFELKKRPESVTVLLYRGIMLERYVANKRNQTYLSKIGYRETDTLERQLQFLKERFQYFCPHEVGIFLGIPAEDVEGFIENSGKNYLMCRYWKVYQNRKRAELLFNIYDETRRNIASSVLNIMKNMDCPTGLMGAGTAAEAAEK